MAVLRLSWLLVVWVERTGEWLKETQLQEELTSPRCKTRKMALLWLKELHEVVEGVGDGCFAAGGVLQLGTAGTNTVEGVLTAGGVGGTYGLPAVEGVTTAGGVDLICTEAVQVVVLFVEGEFTAGGVDLLAVHEDVVGEGCFAAGGVLQLGTAGTTTEDGVLTAGGVGSTYGTLAAGDAAAGCVDFAVQDEVNGEATAGGVDFEDSVQERVEGESAAGGVVLTGVEVQLLDAEWAPAGGRLG
ncbi:hypothetical protein BJ741DRAFT_613194 [Chytriomyces cf. hyalinus JEL632]|nr:hypothetical protein BJ741DRAFT_613194 [Chytriomyces cf. hyalinus JEL632]